MQCHRNVDLSQSPPGPEMLSHSCSSANPSPRRSSGNLLLQDKWPPRATHRFRPWPQTQPLCSHTAFYHFPPDAGGQGDFRGLLQRGWVQPSVTAASVNPAFLGPASSSWVFVPKGSEGSNQQERAAWFPHPLHPTTHLQAVSFGTQDLMSPCFVSLLNPHLSKDAKGCPGPTHPNSSC